MQPQLITKSPPQWLHKTNIPQYAQRQAQSCVYLEELLPHLAHRAGPLATEVARLFDYLVHVHQRQYDDLAQCITIPVAEQRTSFYFDHLYGVFGLAPTALPEALAHDKLLAILVIHGVSYLRGQERYALLQAYQVAPNQPFLHITYGNTSMAMQRAMRKRSSPSSLAILRPNRHRQP